MIRTIFVNDPSEVDYNNVGVHFTKTRQYTHTGGGDNGCTEIKRYRVIIEVATAKINEAATLVSNANFPKEMEVVLEKSQEIDAVVRCIDTQTGRFVGGYPGTTEMKINTGTRCDEWVNNVKQ